MKQFLRTTLPGLLILLLFSVAAVAQETTVTGKVIDEETNEPMIAANVVIKGTTTGVTTDLDGKFSLKLNLTNPVTLEISYLGYETKEVVVTADKTNITVNLQTMVIPGQEVVVTGSRISETILESSASIQKMTTREVNEVASGDFYQGLSNMKGVDISTSSYGFQAVNMRGFNTTSPVRVVQFVDGMDNQAPGLNFPVGNMVGANQLDVQSVEVITGAASALYGPNAFQGVISIKTKDPYLYEGLSFQVKGGNRNLFDGQFRYAKSFGTDNKWAVKLTGGYMRVDDWVANDPEANTYGDIETEQNLSAIVEQLQYDQSLTQEERDDFIALNNYLSFNPVAYQGLGRRTITAPGYRENELADPTAKSVKAGASLHYKITDSLEATYQYKFGNGTAIYQGSNRYSVNNILFQQHKLELAGKNFNVKAYTTLENAGDSYDIVFTGINISKEGIANYISEYLGAYFDTLRVLTDDYDDDADVWMVEQAIEYAEAEAEANAWPEPGSEEFDSLRTAIINNSDLQTGSKFVDDSNLQHVEGQYNFNIDFIDLLAGASFRRYDPNSYGSIFRDTLVNPSDTLDDGSADLDAEFVDLQVMEYGGFIQASKKVLNDKLNLIGSIRYDKNQNFEGQFSPRLSAVYTHKSHVFRVSAQSAFRSPTLQDQYILLNLGPITLHGNLDGWDNLYTLESVQDFNAMYDSTDAQGNYVGEIRPELLKTITLDPLEPEQVRTIEAGYRGSVKGKLYLDVNAYYSIYNNFIGDVRVVRPLGAAQAGEESGVDAILTNTPNNETYEVYQIPINADEDVASYGGGIGASYYFNSSYSLSANYRYATLMDENLDSDIIPGFNTPEHKVNVGVRGRRVWKKLGFSADFQWVDAFEWQSSFGIGPVPAYRVVNAQLSYEFPKYFSTVRLGSSNLLNEPRREIYGGPQIGRMVYISWLFDLSL